jgi:hypothetical protein
MLSRFCTELGIETHFNDEQVTISYEWFWRFLAGRAMRCNLLLVPKSCIRVEHYENNKTIMPTQKTPCYE